MSAKVRTWTWTWTWRNSTSARRVVYDGRPLNAAAGAVMRDAYMDAVRREHFGSAYVEEPRRSHRDSMEEMERGGRGSPWARPMGTSVDLAAGVHGPLRPRTPAVWEDLKDIKPPMYDGNPLNLDRFLEKLDDWGLTVTEDLPPADAERYVFKRFRYRLPEVLGELYFVATKEGKIKTLKDAKKWLNEQERVDAPQVAAKRWKSIKLEHDGRGDPPTGLA